MGHTSEWTIHLYGPFGTRLCRHRQSGLHMKIQNLSVRNQLSHVIASFSYYSLLSPHWYDDADARYCPTTKEPVAFCLFSFAPPSHSLYLLIRSLAFLPSLFQSNFLCHACLLHNSCCLAYGLSLFSFPSENHDTLWFINRALVSWRNTSNIQGFF